MPFLNKEGKYKPTPTFNTEKEEKRFLDAEYKKWVYGWGNLTGEHYFHLTYGCMQDVNGRRIRPLWRDGDAMVFDEYALCKKEKKDPLYIKRREYGISSIFGGTIPFLNSILVWGSTNVITSVDIKRLDDIKNNKMRPIFDSAQKEKIKIFPSEIYDSRHSIRFVDKSNKNAKGSQILYIETSSSISAASNLEGFRASYIFLDEWFLHDRAEIVLETTRATMSKGFEKAGTIVMGGSCNGINKQSVVRLEKMKQQSDALDIKIIFIPGWLCMEGAMEEKDGCYFSKKDEALEMIYKKRQKYKDAEAWETLDNYIKSYPITMNEIIESANAGIFGQGIMKKLNESKSISIIAKVNHCNLLWKNGEVYTESDRNGVFFIYDAPVKGHTYIAGGDPIPGNTVNMSEKRSKFVVFVKNMTTGQYVAYMEMRDIDMTNIYQKWRSLLYYYRSARFPEGAPCMFEMNRIGAIKELCRMYGTMYLLAGDPGKIRKNFYDRGYFKGPGEASAEKLDAVMKNYLEHNTIQIGPLLDDLNVYPKKTDKVDAFQACELYSSYFTNTSPEERQKNLRPVLKRDGTGKTYYHWQ